MKTKTATIIVIVLFGVIAGAIWLPRFVNNIAQVSTDVSRSTKETSAQFQKEFEQSQKSFDSFFKSLKQSQGDNVK